MGFILGFMARHTIGSFLPSGPAAAGGGAASNVNPEAGPRMALQFISDNVAPPEEKAYPSTQGIYPLMRDFQCGHGNMQTPRALRNTDGRGRYVVDIGLDEGEETLDAVENGFIVFGFEIMTGSMDKIRANAEKRGISDRVHFVEFKYDKAKGIPVAKDLPKPPKNNDGTTGFAYIFNAGVSDAVGSMSSSLGSSAMASIRGNGDDVVGAANNDVKWTPGRVPILRLDQALPSWVQTIFFLKIDTQGNEMKVLNGAAKYLQSGSTQYAQYEFSPKLMRSADSGDPLELLKFMTSMGAICFDMMDPESHHVITRPSTPLLRYFESMSSGKNSTHVSARNNYATDDIGPWDDILCWFPEATR